MGFKDTMARLNKADAASQIEKQTSTSSYVADPTYWNPKLDKDGNTVALIRFLPAPDGEEADFVKYFSHYIEGPNKRKYIERCRTSIGENDPAQEVAQRKTGDEKTDKEWYRRFGKSPRFIANILVLQEQYNPDNNGKVLKWEFGITLMKKIQTALKGTDDPIEPQAPINVIHPLNGASFKVVVKSKGGNKNYDDSKFLPPSKLFDGNLDKFEAVWKQAYKLQPLVSSDTFKSYDELEKLLISVVGEDIVRGEKGTSSKSSVEVGGGKTATNSVAVATSSSENPEDIFAELEGNSEPAMTADAAVDSLFENN